MSKQKTILSKNPTKQYKMVKINLDVWNELTKEIYAHNDYRYGDTASDMVKKCLQAYKNIKQS